MEDFDDYLEEVKDLSENYELTTEEIHYNLEHFEQCFENGTDADKALFLLSSFCL